MRADCVNIGETIKALRNAKNISREQLSEMTGISRSHLEKIESGVRRPGIDAYYKIMDVLGVEMVMKAESKSIQGTGNFYEQHGESSGIHDSCFGEYGRKN